MIFMFIKNNYLIKVISH